MSNSSLLAPHSSLHYSVVEVRNLLAPWECRPEERAWLPGITLADVAATSTIPGPIQVTRNGADLDQFTAHCSPFTDGIAPGDTIYIWPEIHPPLVGLIPPAVMAVIQTVSLVMTVVMTVVSVIQGLMANTPDANRASSEQSPSYGFDGVNPSREGYPVAVYYGETLVTPVKLGEYLSTDYDSNQTYHGLFAVGQDVADGLVVAADILINGEPLTSWKNYTIASTIGDNSPVSGVFPNFTRVHQYRSFSRPLEASEIDLAALLHFNGVDAGTTITDATALHTWTCQGDAALSTTGPFLGTACLNCPAADDYVSTASQVYAWDKSGTVELRVKVADLSARGFMGGEFRHKTSLELEGFWSISYDSGQLIFELVGIEYDYESGITSYYTICQIAADATLTPGTWHHICVQKDDAEIALYLDGVSLDTLTGQGQDWDIALPTTTLGRCLRLVGGTEVAWDGVCKIDEVRICTGAIAYEWDGFTPPAEELTESTTDTSETLTTLNPCDRCYIVLGALRGLYKMSEATGNFLLFHVYFDVSYRRVGTVPWTTTEVHLGDNSTQEVRREYGINFPARALYEIKVLRKTPADDSSRTQNETSWIGIDEILDEELLYPNTQVLELNIKADERLRGSVPLVQVVGRRTSITVPQYDGTGTQVVDATNPAWVAYDILTNDLYGAAVSPLTRIDAISHEDWVDWCAGLVATYQRARV
ncbi:MAG: LamG-like jellyroll fold domain-containing protein [Syntrophobacteraceae bacterium]